jgi:hypothetical protein
MKRFADEVALEMAGKAVFDVMDHDGPIGSDRPEWVTCAKTPRQEAARRYASAALSAATPSPQADVVGLEAIGEINSSGTLTWFNPPIRRGTKLYAAPGSTLKPREIECVCKRAICTYDHDFGCGLDRSKERHDV